MYVLSNKYCDAYRFGFNGMEKDDEVFNNTGTAYTTLFRPYDARIGRWNAVDPKIYLTPWESPYLSMGGNPIWHNDPLGDYWIRKKQGEKKAKKMNRIADKKIDEYQNQINQLDKEKDNDKITELQAMISDLQGVKNELQTMADDNEIGFKFSFNLFTPGVSKIIANRKNKTIKISYFGRGALFHEAKHGFQYSIGELSFERDKEDNDPYYTINDEVEAKKREYAISSNRYKYNGKYLNKEGYLKIDNKRWREAYEAYKNRGKGKVKEYEFLLKQYNNGKE